MFPFAGHVHFLCPSSIQSTFVLFSTCFELVFQQNYGLIWDRSLEIKFQRRSCHYIRCLSSHSHCPDGHLADWLGELCAPWGRTGGHCPCAVPACPAASKSWLFLTSWDLKWLFHYYTRLFKSGSPLMVPHKLYSAATYWWAVGPSCLGRICECFSFVICFRGWEET